MDVTAWDRSLDAEGAGLSQIEAEEGATGGFSRPDLDSVYEAPETDSEMFLARAWSELLGIRQIGVNDDFFQLGGHSLHAVRLFVAVRKQFGISLPLSTLFERSSIRPLAVLLDSQSPLKRTAANDQDGHVEAPAAASRTEYSSLVPIQPIGGGAAFYCAAGMGGNPLNLRALALQMGIEQPFYGLQPQGLDGISKLHRTVPEMAAHYIAEIRRKQPNGPYYIGGYSGGGVVAFEMAKQLVGQGERIGALVFLDSVAPGVELPSIAGKLGKHAEGFRDEGVRYIVKAGLGAWKRRVEAVATLMRKPLRRLFPYHYRLENIADTWNEACAAYEPTPYAGDAMLFRASIGFVLGFDIGRTNGWERWILGDVEINGCPGDHASMCEQPHVRVLARRLKSYLQRQARDTKVRDAEAPPGCEPRPAAAAELLHTFASDQRR
jgi:thioesterase domain-containing protein/acyl carrier protein